MKFTEDEIKEFKAEAEELLDIAERTLLDLDKGGAFASAYDSIFRVFHSLKGAAGMMEMDKLQSHMHQLENAFIQEKGKTTLEKDKIDFFLKGTDTARALLKGKELVEAIPGQADPAPVPAPLDLAFPADSAPKGKVVVVDDEPELVSLLQSILEESGFEVFGTSRPSEVLKLVARTQPDALLTDIAMPGITGMDLLAQMHSAFPDIPVIFVSGHVSKDALIDAISNGVYGVIEKPFEMLQVIECCTNAVKRHQLIKILNTSINLIMYQFSDLDDFLKSQGKEDVRKVLSREITHLLEQRRKLKRAQRARS